MKLNVIDNTIERGKTLIDLHDIISFDIFDTLIVRDCQEPGDVFDIVEQHYNNLNINNPISSFRSVRFNAELACYQAGMIPTIDQIYQKIPYDDSVKESLKELEIDIEKKLNTKCYIGHELYKYAVLKNKQIIAVSDMYLSADTLRDLLAVNGYEFDNVFVSCEYGNNKKSGLLFDSVLKELNLKKENVVHFGDNNRSDILGAKKAGIDNCLIPKMKDLTAYYKPAGKDHFADNFLYPFVNNRVPFIDNKLTALGYETCGPMVVGFCQWIHQKIESEKYDRVFFCARDAKQTFDIFQQMYPDHKDITQYLYVSLKSLYTPYYEITGKEHSEISEQQLNNIREYLEQIRCKGKVAIVDSGYGGHTQGMLTAILADQCELHGLYMRISKNFHNNVSDRESYPYMFQAKPEVRSYICGGFFETMISATHGRTNSYVKGPDNRIYPELGDENPKKELLTSFQNGIDRFYQDWSDSVINDHIISGLSIEDTFLRFAFFPKREDVNKVGSITGGNEEYGSIVIKREKKHYLKHPMDFFHDLKETYWKGGFLCHNFKSLYPFICRVYLWLDEMILNHTGY